MFYYSVGQKTSRNMNPSVLILSFLPGICCFIAYDCQNNGYKSTIRYDAQSMQDCTLKDDWETEQRDVNVQLLQEKFTDDIEVVTCTLEKSITIGACGTDSLGKYI